MNNDQSPAPAADEPEGPGPISGSAPDAGPTAASKTPDWAADLAPAQPRRLNPVTAVLLAVLLLAGGFVGGIAVQRSQATTTAAPGRNLPGGMLGRFGTGFPSGGPTPGGAFGFDGGTPVVSGTVASVGTGSITVTAQDGTTVTVHISATTTVSERGSAALQPGAQVQVLGTKATDGSVDATAVVARRGA